MTDASASIEGQPSNQSLVARAAQAALACRPPTYACGHQAPNRCPSCVWQCAAPHDGVSWAQQVWLWRGCSSGHTCLTLCVATNTTHAGTYMSIELFEGSMKSQCVSQVGACTLAVADTDLCWAPRHCQAVAVAQVQWPCSRAIAVAWKGLAFEL